MGATGAGVADAAPPGAAGAAAVPGSEQYAGTDWSSVRSVLEFAASDDLRFALWDQTPGRDVIYIIDPQTVATRSAWVVHLRDIQRMQQQLLMALEDPTRFAGGEREWGTSFSYLLFNIEMVPRGIIKLSVEKFNRCEQSQRVC